MKFLTDSIKELENYKPELTKQPDFDEFWDKQLQLCKEVPLNIELVSRHCPVPGIKVFDLYYDGLDGTRVHGMYLYPANREGKLPIAVCYHGYGWHAGYPTDFLAQLMMGMAIVAIDVRGQNGKTIDAHVYKSGLMPLVTHGILDKEDSYMLHMVTDALRAVDVALAQPEVDGDRLFVMGGSQGGGLSVSVACLDQRVKYCLAIVPSSSNLEERIRTSAGMYGDLTEFTKMYPEHLDKVFETASYFDTMNMADRMQASLYACVGLRDSTCPARCFYATYNRIQSPKEIAVYPFGYHEGGGADYSEKQLDILASLLQL